MNPWSLKPGAAALAATWSPEPEANAFAEA